MGMFGICVFLRLSEAQMSLHYVRLGSKNLKKEKKNQDHVIN